MNVELRMYHLALVNLYKDFDNDAARGMVALTYEALDEVTKHIISLSCNAEVSEIIQD